MLLMHREHVRVCVKGGGGARQLREPNNISTENNSSNGIS